MTKIKFSKLGYKLEDAVREIEIPSYDKDGNLTTTTIEIKQYLPISEKILLITQIVERSTVKGIVRADLVKVNLDLGLVHSYSNLEFSKGLLEDDLKLYDLLESNGLFYGIVEEIPEEEKDFIVSGVNSYAEQLKEALSSSINGYVAQQESFKALMGQLVGAASNQE